MLLHVFINMLANIFIILAAVVFVWWLIKNKKVEVKAQNVQFINWKNTGWIYPKSKPHRYVTDKEV